MTIRETAQQVVNSCVVEIRYGCETTDMSQVEPRLVFSRDHLIVAVEAALRSRDERAIEKADAVSDDALSKLGHIPSNVGFENGRHKAAKEIVAAIREDA